MLEREEECPESDHLVESEASVVATELESGLLLAQGPVTE